MLSRAFVIVNWLLAVFFAVVLGLGWWLFIRTVPGVSGTLRAGVESSVEISRDEIGVAHITARTIQDAYFAQGFVTAQDRLWQMDMTRRIAGGELSEVLGQAALASDTRFRKLRLRRLARAGARQLGADERRVLAAYARGVNHFIETARGRWSPEFIVLRYEPRPWLIEDTLVCGLMMELTLTSTADDELVKAKALASTQNKALVERLFPLRSSAGFRPGSNAWVVSGAHTSTGKPLLANDMHLGWAIPDTWHMAHLKAPGLNVSGVTLPGVPGIIVGHNEKIAWGITNLQTDSQDLYVEKLDPRTGTYKYRGKQYAAAREMEWIAVKGVQPVQVMNLITAHGPLHSVSDGKAYTMRWTAAAPGGYRFSIHALNTAQTWEQFRQVLAGWTGPPLNFVYGDTAGNIGYQAAGRVPIRRGYQGDVPADGAGGEQEWIGMVPFEEMPTSYNPPGGILVTANQNPFADSAQVSGYFGSFHRSRQIRDRLTAREKWDPAATLRLQMDVFSGYLRFLAAEASASAGRKGGSNPVAANEGAALLKGWDGQMTPDSAAAYVAHLTSQNLRRALMERAAPKSGIAYAQMSAAEVVQGLVRERPVEWFTDWDTVLATALGEAVEEARRSQGKNSDRWSWGRYNEFSLDHPVAGKVSWIAPYFRLGPVEFAGAASTVKQTSRTFSPSQRMVVDLGNWERSLLNTRIGQSAHRLSGHYKDQWEAYIAGSSFPMRFDKVEAKRTLILQPR